MEGFRILEITQPSELHVTANQLTVEQEPEPKKKRKLSVPLEDLELIICTGANIRVSTMALSVLSENKVGLVIIGKDYMPSSIVLPYDANVRNASIAKTQLNMSSEIKGQFWQKIVQKKIENQAKCLTLLGLDGTKELMEMIPQVNPDDPENIEGLAAKFYFQQFHPGLVRRNDDPINSVLNYGYAIVRNTIIRDVVCAGFYPAIGIHHEGPFNGFNLADDLIEPWRAMVDVVAHDIVSSQTNLSREQRKQLTLVLHNACMINGEKNTISNGINIMIQSFKTAIEENNAELIKLPDILPVEKIEVISE
ncbi:MAG: type II CRISPR-associated endonuclease Cas1 [Treponema sp.]|nr:type II CRISPR-associated endonuclease Cas1 [Treponema sp.]MBR5645176.1 type II CRISPR-associated endonuclease Cas1 [Treponema sp.]